MLERLRGQNECKFDTDIWPRILKISDVKLRLNQIKPGEFQRVLQQEKMRCRKMLDAVSKKADELGVENPYCHPDECVKRVARMMSIAFHHREQKRKTGEPYSVHLWDTVGVLIQSGFINPDLLEEALAHDAIEDIKEVAEEKVPLLYDFGINDHIVSARGRAIKYVVKAVSKPPLPDGIKKGSTPLIEYEAAKGEQSREYMEILLNASTTSSHPILIKLADRVSNMRTLDGHDNEADRIRIAKETMEVFYPLAQRLGLIDIQEELLCLSLKYLNPRLLDQYQNCVRTRKEKIENGDSWRVILEHICPLPPHVSGIITEQVVQGVRRILGALMDRSGSFGTVIHKVHPELYRNARIRNVELQPHPLYYYYDSVHGNKNVADIQFSDLEVPEYDTVIDVIVEVEDWHAAKKVFADILAEFPGEEWKIIRKPHETLAKTFHVDYRDFSGKVVFRITPTCSKARASMGAVKEERSDYCLPNQVAHDIRVALQIAREQARDIRDVAREGLLFPMKTVYTFFHGDLQVYSVPRSTTIAEFAAQEFPTKVVKRALLTRQVLDSRHGGKSSIQYGPSELTTIFPEGYSAVFEFETPSLDAAA